MSFAPQSDLFTLQSAEETGNACNDQLHMFGELDLRCGHHFEVAQQVSPCQGDASKQASQGLQKGFGRRPKSFIDAKKVIKGLKSAQSGMARR